MRMDSKRGTVATDSLPKCLEGTVMLCEGRKCCRRSKPHAGMRMPLCIGNSTELSCAGALAVQPKYPSHTPPVPKQAFHTQSFYQGFLRGPFQTWQIMELLGGYDSDSSCDVPAPTRAGGRKRPLRSDQEESANAAVSSGAEQQAQRAAAASKQSRGERASSDRFSAGGSSALSSILDNLPSMDMPTNEAAQGPSRPPQAAERPTAGHVRQTAPKPSARQAQQQAQWAHAQAAAAAAASSHPPPQSQPDPPQRAHHAASASHASATPQWAARLDKRTARELAALGMLPTGAPTPPSSDVAGGVAQPAVADVDSEQLYGNWDSQAALKGSLAVPDKRNVTIGYWNAHGEGATTTSAPTRGQKRKNQVNHVAAHFFRNENNYQAADAAAAAHKRSSRSKYGW